ncbi:hypothetical protein BD626DRAFT_567608 [Schizophyllum amplum]|uniref:Enoyl reductase (ER) domain-containing protein n=1 Tax=Schizophyllum amplum TaxID=97359 RepID=A0A550CJ15_9AGAR|nr:hypothetical protein BD626DRAFT_567608 [Auriculariopsis ampla]
MSSSIPATQRAWIIERRGTPDQVLRLHDDWPVPKPQPGEVLVRVEAAALNPVGYKVMGLLPDFIAKRPLPAEHDFAGTVVDANGTKFKEGDAVWGFVEVGLSFKFRQGALCEYLRIPTTHIVPRPANIPPTGAAGMALAGQTAYQVLFRHGTLARRPDGTLEPGQSIFVNGGSSSVGAYAIQIAKAKGAAHIVASASTQNEEMVRALGADEFVDYKKAPVHEQLTKNAPTPKFHIIADAVGETDAALYTHSEAYLAPDGAYVSTGFPSGPMTLSTIILALKHVLAAICPRVLGGTPRKHAVMGLMSKEEDLKDMGEMMAAGTLKPVVDSVFAFEDVLKAYERIMSHRAKGKVVVKVDPNVE